MKIHCQDTGGIRFKITKVSQIEKLFYTMYIRYTSVLMTDSFNFINLVIACMTFKISEV